MWVCYPEGTNRYATLSPVGTQRVLKQNMREKRGICLLRGL